MNAARQPKKGPANANVLAAFRAHTWIRHEEHVDPDDLILEVSKWWERNTRFDLGKEVLSMRPPSGRRREPRGRLGTPAQRDVLAGGPNPGVSR